MAKYIKKIIVGALPFILLLAFIGVRESGAADCAEFRFEFPISNASLHGRISAEGRHRCDTEANVWIILSDGFGYYLQSPEVSIYANGSWDQDNISLGGGIKSIIAVQVNEEGHNEFKRKVKRGEWGQFKTLPNGSKKLEKIRIRN